MTDPMTPVDRLRVKITERLKLARRAADSADSAGGKWSYENGQDYPTVRVGPDDGVWTREVQREIWICEDEADGCPEIARGLRAEGRHIAANDPAFITRACESDLETLAEHTPCPGGHSPAEIAFASDLMRGIRYQHDDPYCHRCLGPSPCILLRRLSRVYAVDLNEGTTP